MKKKKHYILSFLFFLSMFIIAIFNVSSASLQIYCLKKVVFYFFFFFILLFIFSILPFFSIIFDSYFRNCSPQKYSSYIYAHGTFFLFCIRECELQQTVLVENYVNVRKKKQRYFFRPENTYFIGNGILWLGFANNESFFWLAFFRFSDVLCLLISGC